MKKVVEFSDSVEVTHTLDYLMEDINAKSTRAYSALSVIAYASAKADSNTTCK